VTPKQFCDWQTAGGTDDAMRLVDCLERADLAWRAIGGVAVNHWAAEAMVTQVVDLVVAKESVDLAAKVLEEAGFKSERFVRWRGQALTCDIGMEVMAWSGRTAGRTFCQPTFHQ
jgi:hypothetical protein